MVKKTGIALLAAFVAFAAPTGVSAAPPLQGLAPIRSVDIALVTQVQGKNGAVIRSTGQLRTFRPFHVARIRPTFGRAEVRPGRPLAERKIVRPHALARKQPSRTSHGKRPRRPRHIHIAGGVPPELPAAIYEDNTRELFPYSPDFCRFWEDRGVVVGDLEPCW